jgi:protein SCO1/2
MSGVMRRRSLLRLLPAALVLALPACDRTAPTYFSIDITGADYGRDFRLTDPSGKERTLADFRGMVVMLFFGFTQCPDVCPTALARAVEARNRLGADGERVQVVFVTVDPERDTPVVLKEYTAAFDPSFLGLYGDAERTEVVAREFRVIYQKVPTGSSYTMDHTALTFVFDSQGRLRLAVRHEQSADQLAADLRMLIKSSSR